MTRRELAEGIHIALFIFIIFDEKINSFCMNHFVWIDYF